MSVIETIRKLAVHLQMDIDQESFRRARQTVDYTVNEINKKLSKVKPKISGSNIFGGMGKGVAGGAAGSVLSGITGVMGGGIVGGIAGGMTQSMALNASARNYNSLRMGLRNAFLNEFRSVRDYVDDTSDFIENRILMIGPSTASASRNWFKGAKESFRDFSENISVEASIFSTAILSGIGLLGGAALKTISYYDDMNASFKVLLKSEENAKNLMEELISFDKRASLNLEEVLQATGGLLGSGFKQNEIVPMLEAIGNVSSALPINDALGRVIFVLNKIKTNPILMGQELQMLNELTIGRKVTANLEKNLGIDLSTGKDISSFRIPAEETVKAFLQLGQEGGDYFGLMDEKMKSLSGQMSVLQGSMSQYSAKFGGMLKPIASFFISFFNKIFESLKEAPILVDIFISSFGGLMGLGASFTVLAAGFGFVTRSLQAIAVAAGITNVALFPLFLKFTLIAGAIALVIYALEDLYTWWKGGESVFGSMVDFFKLPENASKISPQRAPFSAMHKQSMDLQKMNAGTSTNQVNHNSSINININGQADPQTVAENSKKGVEEALEKARRESALNMLSQENKSYRIGVRKPL